MESFTPIYAITYAIWNSTGNLRVDKEGYFRVLVFHGLLYKRNRNRFSPCSHTVIETLVKVWENSIKRENSRPVSSCFHFNFSFSQTSTRVFITVWKHGKYKIAQFYSTILVTSCKSDDHICNLCICWAMSSTNDEILYTYFKFNLTCKHWINCVICFLLENCSPLWRLWDWFKLVSVGV